MRVLSILPKSNTLLKQGHLRQVAQTASSWVCKINKDGEFTISPGNLCQCSISLTAKRVFSCVSSFMCVLTKLIPSETSTKLLLKEKIHLTHTLLQAYFHCLETSPLRMKVCMVNNNNLQFLPMAFHSSKNFCIVLM